MRSKAGVGVAGEDLPARAAWADGRGSFAADAVSGLAVSGLVPAPFFVTMSFSSFGDWHSTSVPIQQAGFVRTKLGATRRDPCAEAGRSRRPSRAEARL
jgi:hypothetical protein